MLKEHLNDLKSRWNPKERRSGNYDPVIFLETPEQARKLLTHLQRELDKAKKEKNRELELELSQTLQRVENLSKQFFRWEQSITRSLENEDLREIKKLPLHF
jgi:hypothetical protein